MNTEHADRLAVVEELFPYDGPHTPETVLDAARAVSALVRYLNNATGGSGKRSLRYAPTTYRVTGAVSSSVAGLDQLLDQLTDALHRHSEDTTTYDDRHDRPASDTAWEAAQFLISARAHLHEAHGALGRAHGAASHLGHDLDDAEDAQ